jgi:hypothetical protein
MILTAINNVDATSLDEMPGLAFLLDSHPSGNDCYLNPSDMMMVGNLAATRQAKERRLSTVAPQDRCFVHPYASYEDPRPDSTFCFVICCHD